MMQILARTMKLKRRVIPQVQEPQGGAEALGGEYDNPASLEKLGVRPTDLYELSDRVSKLSEDEAVFFWNKVRKYEKEMESSKVSPAGAEKEIPAETIELGGKRYTAPARKPLTAYDRVIAELHNGPIPLDSPDHKPCPRAVVAFNQYWGYIRPKLSKLSLDGRLKEVDGLETYCRDRR